MSLWLSLGLAEVENQKQLKHLEPSHHAGDLDERAVSWPWSDPSLDISAKWELISRWNISLSLSLPLSL